MSKYGTPKDLFNAYSSLVKKMGDQASLIKPPKDANDVEGWNALAKALGVPDNGDGYKFPTINRPEGLPADEKQEGEFRKLAHDLKLTPHQVESLYSHVVNKNIEQFNAMQAQQEQVSKTIESEMSTEYGAAWPDKKEAAQKVIDAFAPDDKEIGQKLLNDPAMIKMLVKLGDRLSEDGIITTPGGSGRLSPKEARAEINKIMNEDSHPYHNNEAAGHKDAVDYMTSLYEMESQGQG